MEKEELIHDKVVVIFTQDHLSINGRVLVQKGMSGIVRCIDKEYAIVSLFRRFITYKKVPIKILKSIKI